MSGQWVFGYGSLVNPASFGVTLGRFLQPGVDFLEADLHGYGRRWNYGTALRVSMPGPDGPDVVDWTFIALGIVAAAAETTNGVVAWVEDHELADLDRRERRYDRVDVSGSSTIHADVEVAATVVTYVPRLDAIDAFERARATGSAAITRRYWDLVDEAFGALGEDRRDRYHATTPRSDLPIIAVPDGFSPVRHRVSRG